MNKSAIFDGLEEDEEELANIFVPRSSVKKLVLKPKIPPTIVSAGKKIPHISNFSCMFLDPNIFSNLSSTDSTCSNLLDMRNLKKQI